MRKKLFNSLCFLVCSLLLLTGCEKDQLLPTDAEDGNKTENELPIRLNADDYDSDNTYYMLNDDEPSEVYFDRNQRSFYVTSLCKSPLTMIITL